MPTSFPMSLPHAPTGFVSQADLDTAFTVPINDIWSLISGLDGVQIAANSATITPTAANTPTSLAVTFPTGRFSTAPMVQVTAATTAPGTQVTGVAVTSVTTTGCTLWLTRTSTTATTVYWVAIAGAA